MEELAYKLLKEKYGYDEFRPYQLDIIKTVVSGQNCIAILPTGFGKSLIFVLSCLLLNGISIIISPLISLMNDQKKELDIIGVDVVVLHSNLSKRELDYAYYLIDNNKVKIIYISPERLSCDRFINLIKKKEVSLFVVDEAHTILWGESFRKSFLDISNFLNSIIPKPIVLALTATATNYTINFIENSLNIHDFKLIKASMIKKNIIYNVINVKNKKDYILDYIKKYKNEKIIIYCLTRKRVEELYLLLSKYNISIYHGGLDNKLKVINQANFTNGIKNVMICTNAFGMGINISDIRHVIHYDIPSSLEDFAQQSGRASRDGKMANEIILFNFKDIYIVKSFIENLDYSIRKKEKKKLDEVIDFCLYKGCRHQFLGRYFGENVDKCKCLCDNCKKNV